jgi:hypothetical protein
MYSVCLISTNVLLNSLPLKATNLCNYLLVMARPQVADTGDCLQTWRVAANEANKQSERAVNQLLDWAVSLQLFNEINQHFT